MKMPVSAAGKDNDSTGTPVVTFVTPLWGFPGCTEYTLQPASRDGVWWLQGVTAPHDTFVLSDPFIAHPEYGFDLSQSETDQLQVESTTDVLALVMLALPGSTSDVVTANFRAPLVFNLVKRRAIQIVCSNDRFSLQEPISLAAYPPREDIAPQA